MSMKTLEQRTLLYWRLSLKWNGRHPNTPKIKTCTALGNLQDIVEVTYYKRPLKNNAKLLMAEIIRGGKHKKEKLIPSTVSQIPQSERAPS